MEVTQASLDRFWNKVVPDGDCLVWTGATTRGYGTFRSDTGKTVLVHRWIYQVVMGEIPPCLELDHLCRNRSCISVYHLEPVTPYENMIRGESFAAVNRRKTHCPSGHPLSGDNIYINHGSRCCRVCDSNAGKAYSARLRAAGKPTWRPRNACKRGHPFTESNTYLSASGRRQCRLCRGKLIEQEQK